MARTALATKGNMNTIKSVTVSLCTLYAVAPRRSPADAAAPGQWDERHSTLLDHADPARGPREAVQHLRRHDARLNGKRSLTVPGTPDRTLTPMEWLVDTMFYPDATALYVFQIQTTKVAEAIGVSHEARRNAITIRTRSGHRRCSSSRSNTMRVGRRDQTLTPVQGQIVSLAGDFLSIGPCALP